MADRPVLILDFGSQYVQLIARRVREQGAFAKIVRHDITAERCRELNPIGLILSGGPSSVYEENAPKCDSGLFRLGVPILGICYGMQLTCQNLGGATAIRSARLARSSFLWQLRPVAQSPLCDISPCQSMRFSSIQRFRTPLRVRPFLVTF